MKYNDIKVYAGQPTKDLVARAHLAAIERNRRERAEKARRQVLELERFLQHQPNGFAD